MRISFDLDDTLICHRDATPAEESHRPVLIRRWFGEPLRLGTRALFAELRRRGCSIWIYTTSGRSPWRLRLWLWLHGSRVDGIVNDATHRKELAARGLARLPSKWPPAFGIDLHVDDSEGVEMEGREFGFAVVVVRPDDTNWVRTVLDAVDRQARRSPEQVIA